MADMMLSELGAGLRIVDSLARIVPWRRIVPTLAARWFGVVSLRFVDGVSKPLYRADRQPAYHMTQVWVANGTRVDVHKLRAEVIWRPRSGRSMDSRTVHGLWYPKVASGLLTPGGSPSEETDLPSNAATRHLGLMVRSSSNKAYIVCTATYNDFGAWRNYEHAPYELLSGVYDVDVLVEGGAGICGCLKLGVQWFGGDSDPIVTVR